jgi:acid phosphatase (class A)
MTDQLSEFLQYFHTFYRNSCFSLWHRLIFVLYCSDLFVSLHRLNSNSNRKPIYNNNKMMKHRLLRLLVVVLTLCGANHVRAQYPDPFFSDDTRPNALYFLYNPPVNSTPPEGEFYNDWWFYEWGKTQREYSYAVWDEDAELMSEEELGVYNDVIGIEIGDKVPEIILLAQRAVSDAARANKVAKNHYQRVLPFAFYGESSITPDRDEHLAQTWSYPSGHSARGWMFALVLCSVAPERAEAIAVRVNAFAMNRVICGHDTSSDSKSVLLSITGACALVLRRGDVEAVAQGK